MELCETAIKELTLQRDEAKAAATGLLVRFDEVSEASLASLLWACPPPSFHKLSIPSYRIPYYPSHPIPLGP